MKGNWFGPKLFGIGIGPRTWQGLLVIAVYVASIVFIARMVDAAYTTKLILVAVATVGLLGVVWLTYEKS